MNCEWCKSNPNVVYCPNTPKDDGVTGNMQCVDCDEIFDYIKCPDCKPPSSDAEIAKAAREYVKRILLPSGNSTVEDLNRINDKLRKLVTGQ